MFLYDAEFMMRELQLEREQQMKRLELVREALRRRSFQEGPAGRPLIHWRKKLYQAGVAVSQLIFGSL